MKKYILTFLLCFIHSTAFAINGFVSLSPDTRHGTTVIATTQGYALAQKFTTPGIHTTIVNISEIGIWCQTASTTSDFTLMIWTHDPINNCPEAIVPDSQAILQQSTTVISKVPHIYPTKLALEGATPFWIGYHPKDSLTKMDAYSTGGDSSSAPWVHINYTPSGDIWHGSTIRTADLGIYVVYTPIDGLPIFNLTITWNKNTELDLSGYRLYHAQVSGGYTRPNFHDEIPKDTEIYSYSTDAIGYHYFALTAFDTSNNESDFSNEAMILLPPESDQAPNKPEGLYIIEIN